MADYNPDFKLTINDVELIEEALRARGRELSQMRLELSEANSGDLGPIQEIEDGQRAGEELLGRLHDQKVFFRPKSEVYVGG